MQSSHYIEITFLGKNHALVAETAINSNLLLSESIQEYTHYSVKNKTTVCIDTNSALTEDEINEVSMKLFEIGYNDFEIEATEDYENVDEITCEEDDFHVNYGVMYFNDDDVIDEAEYQGRTVKLGKPMQGDVKKFKVYVKNPKGNVVKVNFGDPNMRIKKSNPGARRSFRARHNCDNPGPRHKARYWSCRKW
jgi:hypothetical protein